MNLYADSSALAKLILNEPGEAEIFAAVRASDRTLSSAVTYVELRAALAVALRNGRMPVAEREPRLAHLETLWSRMVQVPLSTPLLRRAGNVADAFGLRGYDAVQLTSLQSAGDPDDILFACWDRALRRAAGGLGYELVPTLL